MVQEFQAGTTSCTVLEEGRLSTWRRTTHLSGVTQIGKTICAPNEDGKPMTLVTTGLGSTCLWTDPEAQEGNPHMDPPLLKD